MYGHLNGSLKMKLMGIDVGTSCTKTVIVDGAGKLLASSTKTYPIYNPKPLWSEQNPEEWWEAVCSAIVEAICVSNLTGKEVGGIGVSGQMVGLVVLDSSGHVLRPCIMWNDQRSVNEAEAIREKVGGDFTLSETGNLIFPTFVAPKLLWMAKNEPDLFEKVAHVMMPKDYIVYRLTGVIGTEVSDASGTCLFNVRERKWSDKMVECLGISKAWLPHCSESGDTAGTVTGAVALKTGLRKGTPVAAGAGDQAAQALGSGIVRPGLSSVTIGTSGVVLTQCNEYIRHPNGLLHAFCHGIKDQWFLMGTVLSAGGSFQWLRNCLRTLSKTTYPLMDEIASKASPGCEGLVFLPYLTGERCPYDDPYAKGGWIGLSQRHNMSCLIRSVMEGITFGLLDSLNIIESLGIRIDSVCVSGGAAKSEFWLQMIADIFNVEVVTTNIIEGAALGAAMLAGVAAGQYRHPGDAADTLIKIRGNLNPQKNSVQMYKDVYPIYHSLYPKLKESFAELTSFTSRWTGNR